jgi:hypothetical protein
LHKAKFLKAIVILKKEDQRIRILEINTPLSPTFIFDYSAVKNGLRQLVVPQRIFQI